jgi:hypothetical protein
MNIRGKKKIVLLGMMTRMPVSGVVWQTVHYLVGLERLGYDVYYVEAHACSPSAFIYRKDEDGSEQAARFLAGVMESFGMAGRWAYQALHAEGRYYGMSEEQLMQLYRSAALIINLHGGTVPLPEHYATGRLIYVETDPVELQMELHEGRQTTIDFLAPHCAFFTFGENYGQPDCGLPVCNRFPFRPTRQPVVMDFWAANGNGGGETWTTIGNWKQPYRQVTFNGEVYHWSKHYEFLKFLDVPAWTGQSFELALSSSCGPGDKELLQSKGWRVRSAAPLSDDCDRYRAYISSSRGEFTVAKDQNVRLCSGWFSDRSATYLAAGRPVITQETGFSNVLPTGAGLFAFSTMDDIVAAVESINANYDRHRAAASALAREFFNYDVVLKGMLNELGV